MELYNLDDDPRESTDLAAEHPQTVQRLWKIIEAEHAPVPSGNPNFEMNFSIPRYED